MKRETKRRRVDLALFLLAGVVAAATWGVVPWRWEFASVCLVAAFLIRFLGPSRPDLHSWGHAGVALVLMRVLYPESWATAAAATHLTAIAVGSLTLGVWLAEFVRRRKATQAHGAGSR
jgi:hypothetical protein